MKALNKYLQSYAEPETTLVHDMPGNYERALVVPVYKESTDVLEICQSTTKNTAETLLILVLNRPDHDMDTLWATTFFSCLGVQPHWDSQHLQLFQGKKKPAVLLVDRCIHGAAISSKHGVGLARKIGNDIACYLIAQKRIKHPFMFNTDADVTLPSNYFDQPLNTRYAAAIYPFQHRYKATGEIDTATLVYECKLHYYVAGLQFAQSAFAHHSLGSTLALNYKTYAAVRGFPKRPAGEDFYILNKMAKIKPIKTKGLPMINIEPRDSDRVPFGTGPATKKIRTLDSLLDYPLYHPDCFLLLKQALCSIQAACNNTTPNMNLLTLDQQKMLSTAMDELGITNAVTTACYKHSCEKQRLHHMHNWFDAFRTLKFIHWLRGKHLGEISLKNLLQSNNFLTQSITPPGAITFARDPTPQLQTVVNQLQQ